MDLAIQLYRYSKFSDIRWCQMFFQMDLALFTPLNVSFKVNPPQLLLALFEPRYSDITHKPKGIKKNILYNNFGGHGSRWFCWVARCSLLSLAWRPMGGGNCLEKSWKYDVKCFLRWIDTTYPELSRGNIEVWDRFRWYPSVRLGKNGLIWEMN